MKIPQEDKELYAWISLGLRSGVFTALGLIVVGSILFVLFKANSGVTVVPFGELSKRILQPDDGIIISLGIAVLLLTPIVQVLIAALRFASSRDTRYLIISLALLSMLALSLFMSAMRIDR